jgi:hypothetical protein
MVPTEYNHYIEQGTSLSYSVTITDDNGSPVDLTNATVVSKMRKNYTSTSAQSFTISIIDYSTGKIQISLSPTETSLLKAGRYVYDLMYTLNTITNKVLFGIVTINPSVSYN